MEGAVQSAVVAVHASPYRAVIAATGGASQALAWLLSVPGASNTVLEAVVPYSRRSFVEFLRHGRGAQAQAQAEEQFVSAGAARRMASAAYNRALVLTPPGYPVVGVGCTCALATSSPKRGAHRCHVAARLQDRLLEFSLQLNKGVGRTRLQEEDVASRLLLQTLAAAASPSSAADGTSRRAGTDQTTAAAAASAAEGLLSGVLAVGEAVEEHVTHISPRQQLEELLRVEVPFVVFAGEQAGVGEGGSGSTMYARVSAHARATATFAREGRRVVLSGSFNPLHHGHTSLMRAAVSKCSGSSSSNSKRGGSSGNDSTAAAAAAAAAASSAAAAAQAVGCYELAAVNADKGALPVEELLRRVAQFTQIGEMVVVTGEPLFSGKSQVLPDCTFVVGVDTAVRLINPKYYGGSLERMEEVLLAMARQGCDFVVAPRVIDGKLQSGEDMDVPSSLAGMFSNLHDFRVDISSTEIRMQGSSGANL